MITQITQIAKVEALLSKLQTTRFNALLPVGIEVRRQEGPERYLLQIGNKEVPTQSPRQLEVGARYWGILREDHRAGALHLSRLLKQPALLNKSVALPHFDPPALQALFAKEHPKAELKNVLLHQLAHSGDRHEFMTLTNMIAALNENLFTMVLKEGEQRTMVQLRKRKRRSRSGSKEEASMEFYAAFAHLGPMNGTVELLGESRRLTLRLYYEKAAEFLRRELEHLEFEGRIALSETPIEPFALPVASLLDLKG